MKNFLLKAIIAANGSLIMLTVLTIPLLARAQEELTEQERQARMETMEERRQAMETRRADFLDNNPEAPERMEERRRQREGFLANNPQAATRQKGWREQRRANRQEHIDNGKGAPAGRPEGRFEGRRPGPPPGGGRGPAQRPGSRHDPGNNAPGD